jgi:lipoprotein-anchoring transpeptidase ErfK/SrfK
MTHQYASLPVTFCLSRLAAVAALCLLAACAAPPETDTAPPVMQGTLPGYEGVQDGAFFIEPVDRKHLVEQNVRREVDYAGEEAPGTIVVDIFARKLYFVLEGNRAIRYGIAVGREGLSFKGNGRIGRKEEWPSWQPTANMIRTRPDLYAAYAGGLPGGLDNPLGARALYLYRGGRDTMFRIHGTIDNASVGRATSAGCIRLFNQDAIDLFTRVEIGTQVKVRTEAESLAIEGRFMDDAYGRVVPETDANVAQKIRDAERIVAEAEAEARRAAEAAEAERVAAERAERRRLSACKRQGIEADDCPPLPTIIRG